MFNISIRFDNPLEVFVLICIALICGLWAYYRLKKNLAVNFWPIIVLNLILFIAWGVLLDASHVETGYLHLSWLMAKGLIPYKDFFEHHSPLLLALMAPFYSWFKPTVAIFDILRLISGVILLANTFFGWQIARRVWRGKANISVYLLVVLSVASMAQSLLLRPDLFMILFLLIFIRLVLEISGSSIIPAFFAGAAFSLAASFVPKQYWLVFLPVMAVFLGERRKIFLKIAWYLFGTFIGALPLLFYLLSNDILKEYLFWMLKFNPQLIVLKVYFPLGVLLLGGWGAYITINRYLKSRSTENIIIFLAFILSTLSSLTTTTNVNGDYYLAFWFFICAICCSGCQLDELFDFKKSLVKRSLIFGLLAAVFSAFSIGALARMNRSIYLTDRITFSTLLDYCDGENCLTFLPRHPILAFDTTRLYSVWQYDFIDDFATIRDDAKIKDMAQTIINSKPALVACRYRNRDFILDLFQKDLISVSDYKKLNSFFKENYTQKYIGKDKYYIRNDKL